MNICRTPPSLEYVSGAPGSPAVKSEEKRMFSQAKTKFKTEWKGPYPVKHLLSNPFSLFRSSLHLVLAFFDVVNKLPGFSPNLQVFLP